MYIENDGPVLEHGAGSKLGIDDDNTKNSTPNFPDETESAAATDPEGPAEGAAPPDARARRMMALLEGFDAAYGTYKSEQTTVGKGGKVEIKASARTIRAAVTPELWRAHLEGSAPLGIIPIREDDTCFWGCIDIDVYDISYVEIVEKLKTEGLSLAPCRSKSGGVHLFLFVAETVPAADMQKVLRHYAHLLGFEKSEIFPKQTTVALDRGDLGNWLNMPYYGGDESSNYGISENGLGLTLADFLDEAEGKRLSAEAFAGELAKAEAAAAASGRSKGRRGRPRKRTVDPAARAKELLAERVAGFAEAVVNRGGRNIAARDAAVDLGRFVEAGYIEESVVIAELFAVAQQHGLPNAEARDVVERGVKAGRQAFRDDGKLEYREDSDGFETNPSGSPSASSQHNIRHALHLLRVTMRYDEFHNRLEFVRDGVVAVLDDAAVDRLWLEIDETYGWRPAKSFFLTVIGDAARQNAFHPVRDYLDALVWDGVPRVDGWLSTYGGAEPTPYTAAVGALMLVAAVRRIRQPGVKFDEMLVLESAQGTNKSSALAVLAVQDDWFTDTLPLGGNDNRLIEAITGRWIIEAAELAGMRKSDTDAVKAMLSRREDRGRLAYDRLSSQLPRQCVFFGTTNSNDYLQDPTGNRRFWPVEVKAFDLEALSADRDQLWAEAAAREAQGESIRLDPALWPAAAEQQAARRVEDPYFDVLQLRLGDLDGFIATVDCVKLLDLGPQRYDVRSPRRLRPVMEKLGFRAHKKRIDGVASSVRGYIRGESSQRILVYKDGHEEPVARQEPPF